MFFKLWKYEIKCSYRSYLLMYAILLLSVMFVNANSSIVSSLAAIAYIIMVILTIVMTIVLIIRNYNQSMFSKAGYLTMTLPVSTKKIMLVKILNATLCFILSYAVVIISSLILLYRIGTAVGIDLLFDTFMTALQGLDFNAFLRIFQLMLSLLEIVTMMYMILNFTHSNYIRRHRGIIAVLIFLGLNIAISFINGIIFTGDIGGLELFFSASQSEATNIGLNLGDTVWVSIIEDIVLIGGFYFVASYLLDHKLEIE